MNWQKSQENMVVGCCLGHALHQDGTRRQNCREKRAQLKDTSVKLRETFGFMHPAEIITATAKYCTAAYGSNHWDYSTQEFKMMCNAWTTGHKLACNVPRACRTYLVQNVLAPHVSSLRAGLLHRGLFFFRSLLKSPSNEARLVALLAARDPRRSLGSILELVRNETGLDPFPVGQAELRAELDTAQRHGQRYLTGITGECQRYKSYWRRN